MSCCQFLEVIYTKTGISKLCLYIGIFYTFPKKTGICQQESVTEPELIPDRVCEAVAKPTPETVPMPDTVPMSGRMPVTGWIPDSVPMSGCVPDTVPMSAAGWIPETDRVKLSPDRCLNPCRALT